MTPPDTADVTAARGWRPQIDPTIAFRMGDAKRQLRSSFVNPLGGYATTAMRDAMQRSGEERLMQSGSEAFRQGQYDANQMDWSRLSSLAQLTAPRLVQTGTESSQQGTEEGTSSTTNRTVNTGERNETSVGRTEETNTGSSSGSSTSTSSGNTSGTSSGTGTQVGSTSTPLLPSIISGGAGIGAALL